MIEINLLHGLDEIDSEYNFFGVDHQFDYHYWVQSKYQQLFKHIPVNYEFLKLHYELQYHNKWEGP